MDKVDYLIQIAKTIHHGGNPFEYRLNFDQFAIQRSADGSFGQIMDFETFEIARKVQDKSLLSFQLDSLFDDKGEFLDQEVKEKLKDRDIEIGKTLEQAHADILIDQRIDKLKEANENSKAECL